MIITEKNSFVDKSQIRSEVKSLFVEDINKNTIFDILKTTKVDVVLSAGFRLILPEEVLSSGPIYLNSHPSLLPNYKGMNAIKDAINNNEKYIPLENISTNKHEFEMDGKTFVQYLLKSKIKYVVHSHYGQDCQPSKADIRQCREVGIPYLIVSYPDKEYTILQP